MENSNQQTLNFQTHPKVYKHWKLSINGNIATIAMNVQEDGGYREGYKLKLNSYDVSVDIELSDAVNRLRFEHPEVSVVCIESAREGIFCAGANIFMLGQSSHSHKVNFCKYTNETRNTIEEATNKSNQYYVASIKGIASGGGYELAMACEEIHLVDDRKSSVSLPEVPYLGVLPGTGGLTRLVDKRKVRKDHADVFCTLPEGVKGQRAVEWKLVDFIHPTSNYDSALQNRLKELAKNGNNAKGIVLEPIIVEQYDNTFQYKYITLEIDQTKRHAKLIIKGPERSDSDISSNPDSLKSGWYALEMWRELQNAILQLRFNYEEIGVVSITTIGNAQNIIKLDDALLSKKDHWFIREVLLLQARVLKMIDVTAKSFFSFITPHSCFAGSLFEIALASDRIYMQNVTDNTIALSSYNNSCAFMCHGLSRLENRFYQDDSHIKKVIEHINKPLSAETAYNLGLVTEIPDDIDWDDEIRIVVEERLSLSPDSLTGLEANLRFVGPETTESRIFGRLSAWQNWIFTRPNATGEHGALTSYGKTTKPHFQWSRT